MPGDVERFVVISGCSGGGKSTLIAELACRGYPTVPEPGRRVVAEELAAGGQALPWHDMAAFARRTMTMALADRAAAVKVAGTVFFDRSLVDAMTALEHETGQPVSAYHARHRYARCVFMAPPWPEIFRTDPERRHGFEAAAAEYARLVVAYRAFGYELVELPRINVAERADLVLRLSASPASPRAT